MDPNQQNTNPTPPSVPPPVAGTPPPLPMAPPPVASATGAIPPTQVPPSPAPPSDPTAVSANAPQPGSLPGQGPGQSAPNGKIILFIVVGTLLLIVLGVLYFMAQQLSAPPKAITPTPTQVPTPTSTPTPTPLSEKDIDIIDLGDPETDLKGIEDDVKQL